MSSIYHDIFKQTPKQQEAFVLSGLQRYVVFLHEDKGDKFQMIFPCWASDFDHAEEQALSAYPNGEVVSIYLDEDWL